MSDFFAVLYNNIPWYILLPNCTHFRIFFCTNREMIRRSYPFGVSENIPLKYLDCYFIGANFILIPLILFFITSSVKLRFAISYIFTGPFQAHVPGWTAILLPIITPAEGFWSCTSHILLAPSETQWIRCWLVTSWISIPGSLADNFYNKRW